MRSNDYDTFDELVRGKLTGYIEPPEMESLNRIHAKKARVASLYQLYRLFAVLLVAGFGMLASVLFIQQRVDSASSDTTIQTQPATQEVQHIQATEFAAGAVEATPNSNQTSVSPAASVSSTSFGQTENLSNKASSTQSSSAVSASAKRTSLRSTQAGNNRSTPSSAASRSTKSSKATPAKPTGTTTTPNLLPSAPVSTSVPAPSSEKQIHSNEPLKTDSLSKENQQNETCDIAFNYYGSYTGALTFYATMEASQAGVLTWDFGDGQTSSGSSPEHTFTRPGTYTVSLISTQNGKQCRVSKEIVMNPVTEPRKPLSLSGTLLAGNNVVSNGVVEVFEFNTRKAKYTSTLSVKTQNDGSFTVPLTEGVQYILKGYPSGVYSNYLPTYWGNTVESDEAMEILITPGEPLDILGYNIKLVANEQPLPEKTPEELPVIVRNDNQVILVDANNNVIGMGRVDQHGNIVANEGTKAGSYMAVNPNTGKTTSVQVSGAGTIMSSAAPAEVEKVSVFPNPVDDMVNFGVNSSESENAVLVVMNAAGFELIRKSIVFTVGFNQLQYDISEFSPGIYYVMVFKGNQQVMSNRIVKTGDFSK